MREISAAGSACLSIKIWVFKQQFKVSIYILVSPRSTHIISQPYYPKFPSSWAIALVLIVWTTKAIIRTQIAGLARSRIFKPSVFLLTWPLPSKYNCNNKEYLGLLIIINCIVVRILDTMLIIGDFIYKI